MLLSADSYIGVDQDSIHDRKYNDDDDAVMDDINDTKSLYCTETESVDSNLADE